METLKKIFPCSGGRSGGLRSWDLERCHNGEFSMAVVQGNAILEDQCQVESFNSPLGTFIGVYDGHEGVHASRYILDNIFNRFREFLSEPQAQIEESIKSAFDKIERDFTEHVTETWPNRRPELITTGSCCLVGVVTQGRIFVANSGDSRAVLCRIIRGPRRVEAIQLSTDHNAGVEAIRQELLLQHPDDPEIVTFTNGSWKVKGIIQPTRTIGDVYLKHPQFNVDAHEEKFRLENTGGMPFLSATPTTVSRDIEQNDYFLIFASDGLWEHLTNEQAVEIVHNHPRVGSAKRLVKAALMSSLKQFRRPLPDDISVVILFLDHNQQHQVALPLSSRSGDLDDDMWVRKGKYNGLSFNMAVVQENLKLQDYFGGVYDGHGGVHAARYLRDNFYKFRKLCFMTRQKLMGAFDEVDVDFMDIVSKMWQEHPEKATSGSSCLVGVINENLSVANFGTSRAVLARRILGTERVVAIQLTNEDATRFIGAACLKDAQRFSLENLTDRHLPSATLEIESRLLGAKDSFIIFASNGLWEYLSNQIAVDIVQRNPDGSAKRLIEAALTVKLGIEYSEFKRRMKKHLRGKFYCDISVVVIFLQQKVKVQLRPQNPDDRPCHRTTKTPSTIW